MTPIEKLDSATEWAGVRGLAYDPWMHFYDAWEPEGWQLISSSLPGNTLGLTDFTNRTVTLDPALFAGEARATITHELLHVERGPIAASPLGKYREEVEVERLTAVRLVTFDELLSVAPSADSFEDLAELLNVDRALILTALRLLTNHQHQQVLRFANLHQVSTLDGYSTLRRSSGMRPRRPGRHAIA